MEPKPIFKLAGTIAGQIVYYVLLSYAWMSLGWNAHFLGWISIGVACIVNPLLCAHLANRITSAQRKPNAVVAWLVLFCIVVASTPLSTAIWLHASGYYRHAISNPKDYLGETLNWDQFFNILGMVISGVVFAANFSVLKSREKSRTLRD